jgi:lysophospholipase L1-like esterase
MRSRHFGQVGSAMYRAIGIQRVGEWRVACVALELGLSCLVGVGCSDDPRPAEYAVWTASPQSHAELLPFPDVPAPVPQTFSNQTVRQILHVSAGGDELRVQLSNLYGSAPLTIDAVGVAPSTGGGSIDAAAEQRLTFAGAGAVTIPAGQAMWSDYASLALAPETDLAVSLFVGGEAPVGTVHSLGQQTVYVASGDVVSAAALPDTSDTRQSYYWLTEVDAVGQARPDVVVAFGDSITDGYNSTVDANTRYPNFLSQRLLDAAGPGKYSVVNAGISGNRVLNDVIGPAGVSRFQRDVLGVSGVTDVIILLGVNDIGFASFVPEQAVSAQAIIDGLSGLVGDANSFGAPVLLGTLLPFKGAAYYDEAGEAKRQAVNAWIRSNADVLGVIDFDQVMQDSADPLSLSPAYDSGDHLHPNDQGYAAMASAIDAASLE